MNSLDTKRGSKISVVIPTKNRLELLKLAVSSVQKQTLKDLEIVVVDDGSDIEVYDEILKYAGSLSINIVVVRHLVSKGANAARNTGISRSSAPYIAFLDDDDQWQPTKIARQLDILDKDISLGAVYCGIGNIDVVTGRRTNGSPRDYPVGELYSGMLVRDVTAGTPAYLVRRECFDIVGMFDESLKARQDWDMWIRISRRFQIGCVPEVLVYAGSHDGVRVRSSPVNALEANLKIYEKYRDERLRLGGTVERSALAARLRTEGDIYTFSDQRIKGISSYLEALRLDPYNQAQYIDLLKALVPLIVRDKLAKIRQRLRGCFE
ncbi:MAG: glycosyltransferase [Halioglobus sp.]